MGKIRSRQNISYIKKWFEPGVLTHACDPSRSIIRLGVQLGLHTEIRACMYVHTCMHAHMFIYLCVAHMCMHVHICVCSRVYYMHVYIQ